jgi:hypothetical protein
MWLHSITTLCLRALTEDAHCSWFGGRIRPKKAPKNGFRKTIKKTIILPQDMDVAEKEWRIQKQQKKEGAELLGS